MEALGMLLWLIVLWAWGWPESFGRWLGKIVKAAREDHSNRGLE